MAEKIMAIILLMGLATCLSAVNGKSFDYDKAWTEIEKLWADRLPKSALEKVDSVYVRAVMENRTDQQIKALIYHLRTTQYVDEFSSQKAIEKVQSILKTASFPASAILHSMTAQLYWSYYQNNRWRYSQRTETVDFKQDDIATWDLKTIAKATMEQYKLSLQNAEGLQQYLIIDYPAILIDGRQDLFDTGKNTFTRALRPTLYDFLAHRALEFYINDESGLSLPFEEFKITDSRYFQPPASFVLMEISTPDSLSLNYQALKLYQDLIRFHLNDADPSALVDVNLDRLAFVYQNSELENPEQMYENALRLEEVRHKDHQVFAQIRSRLAALYNQLAALYNPELSEDYRWYYKDALELCSEAIFKYPDSYGGQICAALKGEISSPALNVTTEKVNAPDTPFRALISVKNTSQVQLRIYRIPYPVENSADRDYYDDWSYDNYKRLRNLLKQKPHWSSTIGIENEGDYRRHTYETALPALPLGNYILVASDDFDNPDQNRNAGYSTFSCSNLSYLNKSSSMGTFLIADRNSGVPVKGVTVRVFRREYDRNQRRDVYKLSWTGRTDTSGQIKIPSSDRYWSSRILITSGADSLIVNNFYYYNDYSYEKQIAQRSLLFTDRAIYRPGQTIYLKGVYFETDGEKHNKLLTGKNLEVTFYDVNYQVVSRQNVTTNEYGTFNTTFTAPLGVLTGQMQIQTSGGYVSFRVEEYKRPRFEVILGQPKETYKLDQYVTVTGKAMAYAGFPIDNAELKYRITRQPKYPFWFWWWGPYPSTPAKEISHGTAVTDEKGEFSLTFLAAGDKSISLYGSPYFNFILSVDVTDLSGETRSGTLNLPIGSKELVLNPVVAEKIDLTDKQLTIPIQTTNLSNESIPVSGTVTISRLQTPDQIQKRRLWAAPDRSLLDRKEFLKLFPNDIYADEDKIIKWKVLNKVFEGRFNTPDMDSILIKNLDKWEPGIYVLEAVAGYKQQEIKTTRYFTVYSSKAKLLPYPLAEWFVPVKVICEPGETASVLIGSSYANVTVLYEIEKNHKVVDSLRFTLNKEQRQFSIPVIEVDRGGFYLHFTFIRDGRFYAYKQEITVPWSNKRIDFEYMTFRDKLLPGQEEEWRLKLKDHTGGKVTAELLASMYDASLDAFAASTWYANVYNKIHSSHGWNNNNFSSVAYLNFYQNYYAKTHYPQRTYDQLNWFGYDISRYYGGFGSPYRTAMPAMMKSLSASGRAEDMADMAVSEELSLDAMQANGVGSAEDEVGEPAADLSGVQARTNFEETAFFYPELRTDENGEVSFIFTVPEALTKWKFRALALTKDLKIGTTENTTVTQKPMMVLPNAPRFFREGDTITFSAKITSLDENDQSGHCQLFLFDAITMEPVDSVFSLNNAQQPFSVKKGESTVLSWDLVIPFVVSAVTYRVVAQAGDFSDGEENTLPILTNRMLVTESLPLPVRGNSTKSFVFNKLRDSGSSTTLKHHKLTLEYTSNPAWYAVQALPYMMEYPHDCNEQIFSRLYANSLASHIANANPRINRVFDSWKNTPNSAALLSNLEKNQELKSVLLQETPWVLDAKNESQSKQRIGLLFDLNNMANQFNSAVIKLQKNQSPSGGWPWFPGMPDSWWVTQYIVEGFGHLDHLGVTAIRQDQRIWRMIQDAISFMDRKILEDYENIKRYRNLDNDNLGYMEMHYLYARSFFKDVRIPDETNVAVEYFKGQADKYWVNKDLYGQGLIALALHRYDKKVTPGKVIASLRERALHDEEMGMWWKNENWGWFWYQAPIETQSLLIEAFHDIAKDTDAVDGMRTWLLKQKQTTNWKTTKATAEACYALLLSGTEWLDTEQLAEIIVGGKIIDPMQLDDVKVEAGTGYFKTSWHRDEIKPEMATVTVINPNRVSAWGSLYWQYFENLDKITPAETPLKLNKKLFIERITDTGKVIEPISDNAQLSVGDKIIVRIELRSDRDMEYVHMKDMRSAGFEPINVLSRYKWQDGLGYYEATGDAATNFFIEYLRKGTYVFEYPLRVTNKGDFSNGITSIQCMYAPEFSSHSEGIRVIVK